MLIDASNETHIVEHCHAVPSHPDDRRGFSEEYIRSSLERQGWDVWRGGYLHANRKPDVYPNVERRYREVERLLGDHLTILQYIGVVHHGMPDLLCYKLGTFKFVECKLGYETLRDRQRETIKALDNIGFDVELHRVVEHATKRRVANLNVDSGDRQVITRQEQLKTYR